MGLSVMFLFVNLLSITVLGILDAQLMFIE